MRKVYCLLLVLPTIIFAQEISIYGNRGMFKLQYAQPHNMGVFSFHFTPEERFESFDVDITGRTTTDRKHFFQITSGFSYAIVDFMEIRFHAAPFMKWYEASDYPEERGDEYPPIGMKEIEAGVKFGYPIIVNKQTPLLYALGVDGAIVFGPGLSTEYFSNAWENDRQFYADSFYPPYYIKPNFLPHIPHDPDYRFTGLFDFRIGPFAAHMNAGYLVTGIDENPGYVDSLEFIALERPNYFIHAFGIELIPSNDARILFETYGMFDTENNAESLWVTPGLRFGSTDVSFDLGCELGIMNPNLATEFWWKAFFTFSAGADLIKKVEIHIPIAQVSGRVYDGVSNEPLYATITFPGSDQEPIQTTKLGTYTVSLTPGTYRMHVEASNYRWKEQGVVVKDGDQLVLDFNLNRKPISKILGKIYDAETRQPVLATINFAQTELEPITSDTAGMYSITLAPGIYRLRVEATNYQFSEEVVTLAENESKVVDIALAKIPIDKATLTGKVSEVETNKSLLAQLTFVDTKIPRVTTDPNTGIFKVIVPPGTYSVIVEAADYITESAPVVLAKDETKIQNFQLKPIPKVGEKIILRGIYFDFNASNIKPESYPVLDDAAKVLKAKPKMRVEISGHTDSIGSDSYNQTLSYQRANAVRQYLITYHQIDPNRLAAMGYGESQPIADNRSKSGRDQNRRIEFKILSWE
ncbi:hypothetical protein A2Y85_06840 [candidate division WOR-3 bacterium RBG_13_43_14]|uniref:OmpA-like domain-containing protein n=1 Tax=candidate division WOR-3 bacterium RBG_13_43_14 TaxID=1802590 RepID=A0A1F4UE09_UNCW3|nr:MAG: hypothetical protein A2Y85_06840 [candidate division WOR-3 bacterium RBG_13_43_14]